VCAAEKARTGTCHECGGRLPGRAISCRPLQEPRASRSRRGVPQAPEDLANHNGGVGSRITPDWHFIDAKGEEITVTVQGNSIIDSGDALREAAVAGLGIVQGTWWLFRKDLERGSLQSVLTDYTIEGAPISVLYAANRHLPQKVRVFIDFLIAITKTK